MGLGCVPYVQDIFKSSVFSIQDVCMVAFKIIKMYKIQLPISEN